MVLTLGEIAKTLNAKLVGDGSVEIGSMATITDAQSGDITFLANQAFKSQLATTKASAVVVHPKQADECLTNALIVDNPYLGYAQVSALFNTLPKAKVGIHPSASVSDSAIIGKNVSVAAHAVIEDYAELGDDVVVGPGSIVGEGSLLGRGTRLHGNVTLYHGISLGVDCIIHSGVVIGGDGFGFAPDGPKWHKIHQVGAVVIGNNVEIGANTTIDRGALNDTVIKDGVKLDNQIQIAHNVEIGENTAMAACVGIAGSTKIGANCTFSGGVGIAGHLNLVDGTHATGMALISRSTTVPGSYSSGTGMAPTAEWKKSAARFRKLDDLAKRLVALEKAVKGQS